MLCHLETPGQAFAAIRNWLRPGGVFLAVDGFWPASAWSESDRQQQPFACLENTAALKTALEQAGFEEVEVGPATALNDIRQREMPESIPRYQARARRPFEAALS